MKGAVENSHRTWRPDGPIAREAFGLDETSRKTPSLFSIDAAIAGIRYQYGFSVNNKSVRKEWLNAYPNGRKQAWFSREFGRSIEFSSKLSGENKAIEALTRPNSLYLPAAAQNNHESLTPIYQWFVEAFYFVSAERSTYRHLTVARCGDENDRKLIALLVQIADLGIADLRLKREDISEEQIKAAHDVLNSFGLDGDKARAIAGKMRSNPKDIELLHWSGKNLIAFSLGQESDGTVAYFSMLGPILAA